MSPLEEKIYYPLAKFRTEVFRPINKLLTATGVTADMVSYSGVLLMVAFASVVPVYPGWALALLFARMMADIMDGPLARYQKTDNDRGKFVDVLMDNLSFALFIFGSVRADLLAGTTGSVYLFVTELLVVLGIILYNIKHRKSDWFFYASAGSLPYNFVYASYVLFGIYAFGGHNYLTSSAKVFSLIMLVFCLTNYWNIQNSRK